jgi:AcrR family transcriptional regulator
MARTVKPEQFSARRGEILDAAQRLMFSKGFEQMSVQDILNEVNISSGAFHHYFGSREALLDAFIERIRQGSQVPLLPLIHDPHLSAIEKLQGFFNTLDSVRVAYKAEVFKVWRVWYTDANAIVRLKVDEAILKQRAPLLNEIVRQGIQEGSFTCSFPETAGEVMLSQLQGMTNTHAHLLLSIDPADTAGNEAIVEQIITVHAAYLEALERMLGAPANCLVRTTAPAVQAWIAMLKEASPA